jgi:hypothetical protein
MFTELDCHDVATAVCHLSFLNEYEFNKNIGIIVVGPSQQRYRRTYGNAVRYRLFIRPPIEGYRVQ